MFFVFGWNRQKVNHIGPVLPKECNNCHNTEYWQLYKITKWFTLFFIPVIPYDNKHLLVCPVCHAGIQTGDDVLSTYKSIAELNNAHAKNMISDSEREAQIEVYLKELEDKHIIDRSKHEEESKSFTDKVRSKTDAELAAILQRKSDYAPAFLIAVEDELKRRAPAG